MAGVWWVLKRRFSTCRLFLFETDTKLRIPLCHDRPASAKGIIRRIGYDTISSLSYMYKGRKVDHLPKVLSGPYISTTHGSRVFFFSSWRIDLLQDTQRSARGFLLCTTLYTRGRVHRVTMSLSFLYNYYPVFNSLF